MRDWMDKYSTPPLTIDQQIQLLKDRNLVIDDEAFARRILATIGYYRLTAYLYPFRLKDCSDNFTAGISIEKVCGIIVLTAKCAFCSLTPSSASRSL